MILEATPIEAYRAPLWQLDERCRYQLSRVVIRDGRSCWVVTANAPSLEACALHADRIGGRVLAVDKLTGEPAGEWIEGIRVRT